MQTFQRFKWNHIENMVMVPRGSAGSIPLATAKIIGKVYQVLVGSDLHLGEILAGANPITRWVVGDG
jgi:hypothetical protein